MYANFWIKISTVAIIKKFKKKLLDEKMNDFYRRIKLKAHFRDNAKAEKQTEVRNQPMKSGLQIKIITLSKLA